MVRSFVGDLPPGAVFSHRSALIIHGLPVPYIDERDHPCAEVIHPGFGVRRPALLVRKRLSADDDVVLVDGIAVTSLLRTLVDIARDCPLDLAVAAADSALRRSLVSIEELKEAYSSHPVRTHQRRIASMIENVDARRESIAESISAVRFVENSVPGFEPQVVIFDEKGQFIGRTDFANEQAKVIAEFDGAGKYYLENADPKQAFELERRREYLLRNQGYTVFRMTWADLFRGDLFLRIKAAVARRTQQRA